MPGKIKVSSQCFSEIAQQLAKQGQEINKQGSVIIEKDMTIEQPYDFRLATIRKDCLVEAVKAQPDNPISLAKLMFDFVLNGSIEQPTTKEWK